VIAVLVPSLSNAVFSAVLDGIHDAIEASQYQVLIGNTHYSDAEEEKLLNIYMQSHPDGILLSGLSHSPAVERMLASSRVPIVSMMDLADDSAQMSVGFSQYEAGLAMTRHLLERGYRRVAFIAAQLDERSLRRADGYRDAMQAAGLFEPRLEVMVSQRSTIKLGAELMRATLERIPDCDAVFCCNDDLAYGAIYYCQRQGIRIPQQVAVGGFNDLQASAWMVPALTTVETPRYRVGFEAASLLLQAIEGRQPAQRRIDLGFALRAREST
jgi:LacI family gluconate utilization system Gnt-I transcriptional repressor